MMKKATMIFLPDDFLRATLLLFEMNGFLDLLMTDKRCLDYLLFFMSNVLNHYFRVNGK